MASRARGTASASLSETNASLKQAPARVPTLLRALGMAGLGARRARRRTVDQAQAIPALLDGRDMLGIAQTGTGKTAAFGLPSSNSSRRADGLQPKSVRALILAPTRELAIQIDEEFPQASAAISASASALVYGGVGHQPQICALEKGVDILVATPGRLLDHLQAGAGQARPPSRISCSTKPTACSSMGFVRDAMKIIALLPEERQSLLFSATMPAEVATLSRRILRNPIRVEVTPEVITVERIDQRLYHVPAGEKRGFLVDLLSDADMRRVIVFTRTRASAPTALRSICRRRASTAWRCMATSRRARVRRHSRGSATAASACSSRPTSPRAASTSPTSPMSSTLTCLTNRKPMSTASDGRRAPGATALPTLSSDAGESARLKAIERLIRRPIPEVATHFSRPGRRSNTSLPIRSGAKRPAARDSPCSKRARKTGGAANNAAAQLDDGDVVSKVLYRQTEGDFHGDGYC